MKALLKPYKEIMDIVLKIINRHEDRFSIHDNINNQIVRSNVTAIEYTEDYSPKVLRLEVIFPAGIVATVVHQSAQSDMLTLDLLKDIGGTVVELMDFNANEFLQLTYDVKYNGVRLRLPVFFFSQLVDDQVVEEQFVDTKKDLYDKLIDLFKNGEISSSNVKFEMYHGDDIIRCLETSLRSGKPFRSYNSLNPKNEPVSLSAPSKSIIDNGLENEYLVEIRSNKSLKSRLITSMFLNTGSINQLCGCADKYIHNIGISKMHAALIMFVNVSFVNVNGGVERISIPSMFIKSITIDGERYSVCDDVISEETVPEPQTLIESKKGCFDVDCDLEEVKMYSLLHGDCGFYGYKTYPFKIIEVITSDGTVYNYDMYGRFVTSMKKQMVSAERLLFFKTSESNMVESVPIPPEAMMPIDTPVFVWDNIDGLACPTVINRHFKRYDQKKRMFVVFPNGMTSHTCEKNSKQENYYEHCRKALKED